MKHTIGLIVNPIAGVGGAAGFKGSDDPELVERAFRMGYRPISPSRALSFLEYIRGEGIMVLTYGGVMGEEYCQIARVEHEAVGYPAGKKTTAEDTVKAARELSMRRVKVLVFVGGDGTARDVLVGIGDNSTTPVVGVPAGVKVFSEVFALSAEAAAKLVIEYLLGEARVEKRAVIDIDEEAYRKGSMVARRIGELYTIVSEEYVQSGKITTQVGEIREIAKGIADTISAELNGALCIFGPGLTVKEVAKALGIDKSTTSLIASAGRRVILVDPDARSLEKLVRKWDKVRIVISPVGGTGFLLGRGNQQITLDILRKAGKKGMLVVATPSKIAFTRQLLVDASLREVRQYLGDYIKIVTGYREYAVKKVKFL